MSENDGRPVEGMIDKPAPDGRTPAVDNVRGPDEPKEPPSEESAEVTRLETEVTELRAKLAQRPPSAGHRVWLGVRRTIAAVLVALAGFGVVASVVGVWGARTTLNTDRWVATVAPLPQRPEVNAAVATYLTDEVFSTLNLEQRLASALPPKATFLAGPVSGAVHNYVYDKVKAFMGTPQFQSLWKSANRFAHAKVLAVLEGRSKSVSVNGSTVTLNMLPIVNDALVAVSNQLPTLFGKQLTLPTLTSGQVPPDLRQKIENAVGVQLPANFAQITFYNHNELSQLQTAVVVFKRAVVLLVVGSLLCLAGALLISTGRRRTILQFGVALAISVVALTAIIKAVRDQLLAKIPEGTYRTGASVAMQDITRTLRQRGDQFLWLGIIIAVVAYLVGPGRLPVALRRKTAEGARWLADTVRTFATSDALRYQSARHVDALRIGGAVVAALLVLVFSSWISFFVLLLVLIGYEVLVTLLARWGRSMTAASGATGT